MAANSAPADCAEIINSKLHKSLDRKKMFDEAWWLQYCCCAGRAIGVVGDPIFAQETRNLCLHETLECTGVGDPFCQSIGVECCITTQCSFPKIDGSPTCVCCNKKLAGGDTGAWKPQLFDYTFEFDKQFWIYYFLCAGYSLHGCSADGRPILGYVSKQLCIKGAGRCVAPIQNGILCSGLGTQLCCWAQMQLPPVPEAQGNPMIACCGIKWKNKTAGTPAGFMGYGKPSQCEMK